MRVVLGLAVLSFPLVLGTAPLRADTIDPDTQTTCRGERCVGSYCENDGDAYNCWQESVHRRKGNEEVHWICTKPDHQCRWIVGAAPYDDRWSVLHLFAE